MVIFTEAIERKDCRWQPDLFVWPFGERRGNPVLFILSKGDDLQNPALNFVPFFVSVQNIHIFPLTCSYSNTCQMMIKQGFNSLLKILASILLIGVYVCSLCYKFPCEKVRVGIVNYLPR